MRATVTLDDEALKALMKQTGEKSQTRAIQTAVCTYIQSHRLAQLRALKGKDNVLDNAALEEAELSELDLA